MPSNVSWVIKDQLLTIKYTGTITTDDVIHSTTIGQEWLQHTENTVHVINDLIETDGLSPSFQKVGDILSVTRSFMQMDNMGLMVAYGTDNRMLKFLSNIVAQVGGIDFRMFDTYPACREYLLHNVPDLASLPDTVE